MNNKRIIDNEAIFPNYKPFVEICKEIELLKILYNLKDEDFYIEAYTEECDGFEFEQLKIVWEVGEQSCLKK